MSDEQSGWAPFVAFTDGSVSFCNGFAAGQVWAQMRSGAEMIEGTIMCDNSELMTRMARALGYSLAWNPLDETWANYVLVKTGPERGPNDPIATGKFSVIDGGKDG